MTPRSITLASFFLNVVIRRGNVRRISTETHSDQLLMTRRRTRKKNAENVTDTLDDFDSFGENEGGGA